jgi:hypothetical protein
MPLSSFFLRTLSVITVPSLLNPNIPSLKVYMELGSYFVSARTNKRQAKTLSSPYPLSTCLLLLSDSMRMIHNSYNPLTYQHWRQQD